MPIDVAVGEASDRSSLVSFGREISAANHRRVLALFRSFQSDPVKGVTDLHPAYNSLLIQFDALRLSHAALEQIALERSEAFEMEDPADRKTIEIPVCYSAEFGPDLEDLARLHQLSAKDVIELHASEIYTVYFLGFVPGFAYLGMVPERIATPRLPAPRKQVASGSVGIADRQTGVYPTVTPGGWRLIGRTPVSLFDANRPGFSLLHPGDQVRFRPVPAEQFHLLAAR